MVSITSLNNKFCEGANELRYAWKIDNEIRFSKDKAPHPKKGSWLRSIKYKDENAYLCVFDIDSEKGLDKIMLKGVKGLYDTIKNYFGIEPVLKASGSKGAQIIFKLTFEENIDERTCIEHMRNLAYTTWKLSTPNTRRRIKFNDVPGIDCKMFEVRRMLRSFCMHLGSGKFSVPFNYEDDLETIEQRMELALPLIDFEFPSLKFDDGLVIYKFDHVRVNAIGPVLANLPMVKAKKATKKDDVYRRMPSVVKKLVTGESIPHDLRWPVIVYLRIFERMGEGEIIDWLFKFANWDRLSNLDTTKYHVTWTCNWCDKKAREWLILKKDDYILRRFPMPNDIKDEILEEKTSKSSWKRAHRALFEIWNRYLRAFVTEQSSALQTEQ